MRRGAAFGLALAFVAAATSPVARAQSASDRASAHLLMDEGDKHAAAKEYEAALKSYQAANALMHVPTTSIEVARMLGSVGRLLEARELALDVARSESTPREPPAFKKARLDALTLTTDLERRIPTLQLKLTDIGVDAPVAVRIDGRIVPSERSFSPRALDPGQHVVEVAAVGFATAHREVLLIESHRDVVEIAMKRDDDTMATTESPAVVGLPPGTTLPENDTPHDPPTRGVDPDLDAKPTHTPAFVAFGVGGAGLVLGTVTGVLTLSKASSIKDACTGNVCPASNHDDRDSANTLAWVSNASFGVALVGAGVGTYLLLRTPSSDPRSSAPTAAVVQPLFALAPGAGRVGLTGRF